VSFDVEHGSAIDEHNITNVWVQIEAVLQTRAFSVAGPAAWICLSDELRELLLTANSFRQLLKTRLFAEY